MTDPEPDQPEPMIASVRLRQERLARQERDRPLLTQISMIGALGWLIVTPALLGILAGRLLDRMAGSGIFCTGALLVLGLALGCWQAWKRMTEGRTG